MEVEMNVTVEVTGVMGWISKAACLRKDEGSRSLGLWGYTPLLSCSATCVGWGASIQEASFSPTSHTTGPPKGRGDWEGRGGLLGQATSSAGPGNPA